MAKNTQWDKKSASDEASRKLDINAYVDLKFQILEQKLGGLVESRIKETIRWFATAWSVAIAIVVASFTYQAWGWVKSSTAKKIETAFLQENIQRTIEETAIHHAKTITEGYIAKTVADKIVPLENKIRIIDEGVAEVEKLDQRIKPIEGKIAHLDSKAKIISAKIDDVEVFAKKDIYRPLSQDIREKLIREFQSLEGITKVYVDSVNANVATFKVREDLLEILKVAGIQGESRGESIGLGGGTGVTLFANNNTLTSLQGFAKVLGKYFTLNFDGQIRPELQDGEVIIEIRGKALFHKNGTIELG